MHLDADPFAPRDTLPAVYFDDAGTTEDNTIPSAPAFAEDDVAPDERATVKLLRGRRASGN